jgi:hypothetical protein
MVDMLGGTQVNRSNPILLDQDNALSLSDGSTSLHFFRVHWTLCHLGKNYRND